MQSKKRKRKKSRNQGEQYDDTQLKTTFVVPKYIDKESQSQKKVKYKRGTQKGESNFSFIFNIRKHGANL